MVRRRMVGWLVGWVVGWLVGGLVNERKVKIFLFRSLIVFHNFQPPRGRGGTEH